nr:Candidapepsin-7 like [Ipomoea batatas]GME18137.1 Candidapepsin-7 like [Ipomoea batatas]
MSSREKIRLPLRKLFTKEREAQSLCSSSEADEMDGILPSTYCVWRPKAPAEKSSSPKNCKKRNSTGWSKRWKLRDLIHRNNSEGNSYSTIIHTHKKKH